jgi:PKD repeat protein
MSNRRAGSVVTLVAIAAALFARPLAAQQPAGVVAYDWCHSWGDYGALCGVFLVAGDGSNSIHVGDGIVQPVWSADGSHLAFIGDPQYSEPSLYLLNLTDWSIAQVPGLNAFEHPALSPDGKTIAFECMIDAGNRDICAVRADGTGFVRLTSDPGFASTPRFSVDGSKIGFANPDWVVINADGTGITTAASGDFAVPAGTRTVYVQWGGGACDGLNCQNGNIYIDGTWLAIGNNPTWALSHHPFVSLGSPQCDGLTCVFDGSGSWVSDGTTIGNYSWNFGDGTMASGRRVSHEYLAPGAYTVTLTGMTTAGVSGGRTATVVVDGNRLPAASFTYACLGSECAFDGSGSSDPDGPVASYFWYFGDGAYAGGAVVNHRYSAIGTFTVALIVTDDGGARGEQQQSVVISSVSNAPPVALFTTSCAGLSCTVSAVPSTDPDGHIKGYTWNFGDGTVGEGTVVEHTYAAPGTYAVTLSVTDNLGATGTRTQTVTAVRLPVHVSDLDGAGTAVQSKWNATVTVGVHDSGHAPVAGVVVTGLWSDGTSGTCTTTGDGRCAVIKPGLAKTAKASFRISDLSHARFAYTSGGNHDPDGDSNGTAITFTRR